MIKQFIYSIMLKKGFKAAAKAAVAFLIVSIPVLKQYGIDIHINEAVLTAAIISFLEMGRNYLKQKYNIKLL